MLAASDGRDEWLQHTGAGALASLGDTAALEALASHASKSVRSAAVVALRRLHHEGVARFLADADEGVATDAARAINDDGGIAGAIPQLAARLGAVKVTNEPLVRRAINANVRLGTPEAVARLEALARDTATPSELRIEAIAALGVWGQPSPMDRVDGFYHSQVTVAAGPRMAGNRASGSERRAAADTQGAAGDARMVLAGAGQGAAKKPVPKAPVKSAS